ncbi:hypothetical protein [Parerythrobacter jejuensis]|uniref:PRC-barrel domain-containing protein n=1 Tax=Parerythrobacter jejuensis TaxID=795812 RepID=A0A845ASB1_9SPHN|nr:hypothetical protein [Parerythrobacter jejuensis]MXP31731.1 hypothetical protein [Parerythrobacter jejuensis]
MKFIKIAGAAAALALATSASAAAPEVGATVFGPEGNEVGTVTAADAATVTIDTGKHQAPVPANVLADGPDGPVISVTKVQLNQIMDQQKAEADAKRDAALVAGAMVHSADDAMLGNVASIDGDDVVVTLTDGSVALKREHFALNASGTLVALFTAEQIAAAVASATDASSAE